MIPYMQNRITQARSRALYSNMERTYQTKRNSRIVRRLFLMRRKIIMGRVFKGCLPVYSEERKRPVA